MLGSIESLFQESMGNKSSAENSDVNNSNWSNIGEFDESSIIIEEETKESRRSAASSTPVCSPRQNDNSDETCSEDDGLTQRNTTLGKQKNRDSITSNGDTTQPPLKKTKKDASAIKTNGHANEEFPSSFCLGKFNYQ